MLRSPDVSKSHRRLSATLGLSCSSVYTILKDLKLKPYIPRLCQALNEDDHDRRLEFCETWNGLVSRDATFPNRILWSDEAKFHLSGAVNRHNCVYWRETPPPESSPPEVKNQRNQRLVRFVEWRDNWSRFYRREHRPSCLFAGPQQKCHPFFQ